MGTYILVISQLRTAEHLWIVWRDNEKRQETLKVKIRARKCKRCHTISKEIPQRLLALFWISLSLHTIHACFVVPIMKWLLIDEHIPRNSNLWNLSYESTIQDPLLEKDTCCFKFRTERFRHSLSVQATNCYNRSLT